MNKNKQNTKKLVRYYKILIPCYEDDTVIEVIIKNEEDFKKDFKDRLGNVEDIVKERFYSSIKETMEKVPNEGVLIQDFGFIVVLVEEFVEEGDE